MSLVLHACWSSRSGVRVNAGKCTYTWLGKRPVKRATLLFDSQRIPEAKVVKHLGIMLEPSLKWHEHMRLLADRNLKLIALMRKVNALAGGLELRHRLSLYNQLYLSTMLYGSDVWGPQLTETQKNNLRSMQRKAILSLTGAYASTNSDKLLNLLGLLEINEEIEFRLDTRALDSTERKEQRTARIAERRLNGPQYDLLDCNLSESTSREIFFFATAHGPFLSLSHRFNNEVPLNCRFCGIFEETAEHLLLFCSAFEPLQISRDTVVSAVESKCKHIVRQISHLN